MRMSFSASLWAALLLAPLNAAAQDAFPAEVAVRDIGSGRLFVNDEGFTLYTFKTDKQYPGTSACIEECAAVWPPVAAPADATATEDWSVIERQDGSSQWAYQGSPVYTYAKDTHPGAIVGEKASGLWDVLYEPIETPPDITIQASVRGQILATALERTIYTGPGGQCDDVCMNAWRPVEAPWLAKPATEDWTITRRSDGLSQWVYKSQPLFTYDADNRPGEMNGLNADGDWSVVVLKPAPEILPWITIQETDIGPVMATADRMTLYYQVNDPEQIRRETCDDTCVAENWNVVIAPEGAQPAGNWTISELGDGRRQWYYLGYPVYTFKRDYMPGDTYGDKFGTGSEIRGGWTAILQETLIQKLSS
jgi:predicted lipoprotein with Yx(FWY)xxD motif